MREKKTNANLRAIKLWHSLCPSNFFLLVGDALFSNLSPYFNIYLSAEIVNEVAGARSVQKITTLVLITIFGNLAISVICGILWREFSHSTTLLRQREDLLFNNKTLTLDYENLERTEVRQMRRKIIESANINMHGKGALINGLCSLADCVINIVLSVYLFAEMFVLIIANELNWSTLLFAVLLVTLVCLNVWINFFTKKKMSKITHEQTETMTEENRISSGLDCYNMGKDVRLYRQDKIIIKIQEHILKIHGAAFKRAAEANFRLSIPGSLLSFKYPEADSYALRDVSIKFNVGEKLAVVGMNGSGKTTFIKLLCRLYDPVEGEILLNGKNIKEYNYTEYMSIFSVVFQDFKLFSFTLDQNVAVSMKSDKKKVEECLIKTGFGDRLANLPSGVDTYIYKDFEEAGVEVSGGEAQKIALARALYKDAEFIVLDEPTAALDPIAEFEVYSKFNEIVNNKTAIFISHRLSSCKFCENIVVFHEGKIIQYGNHDNLIADKDGKYNELWYAQAKYYTESSTISA